MSARRALARIAATTLATSTAAVGLLAAAGPAHAACLPPSYCGPAYVTAVSKSTTNQFGYYGTSYYRTAISTDGRYVAFTSYTPLIPTDTNDRADVYRRDVQTGELLLASTRSDGSLVTDAPDHMAVSMSGDGRYVTFTSYSPTLVPGDTNNAPDVFRKDLASGAMVRVNTDQFGGQFNGFSGPSSISADGRYVAFQSGAWSTPNVPLSSHDEIYRKDMLTGALRTVSTKGAGKGNGNNADPAISADGRYVAFTTYSTNFDLDGNDAADVYRKDVETNTLVRVSVNANGIQGNGLSWHPSPSADGRYVAFTSKSTNLTSGDTNGWADIFRKDLTTGAVVRVTGLNSVPLDKGADRPSLSNDGRVIAFESYASNVIAGDTNGEEDVFIANLDTGGRVRASVTSSGGQASLSSSEFPSLSGNGKYTSFPSAAALVSNDNNTNWDVYRSNIPFNG